MLHLKKIYRAGVKLGVLLALLTIIFLLLTNRNFFSSTIEHNPTIELTPAEIKSIREIGEWEFLSLPTEELADTIRKGILTDDRLVRIYYGTLRLGINLEQASPDWITTHGDTVYVKLPPIQLLDKHFINEAQTKAFYESGTWSESAKRELYYKAYNAMKRRCMTEENLRTAETNARKQIASLFRSFGFREIIISF